MIFTLVCTGVSVSFSCYVLWQAIRWRNKTLAALDTALDDATKDYVKAFDEYKAKAEERAKLVEEQMKLAFNRGYALGVSETTEKLSVELRSEEEKEQTRWSMENWTLQ